MLKAHPTPLTCVSSCLFPSARLVSSHLLDLSFPICSIYYLLSLTTRPLALIPKLNPRLSCYFFTHGNAMARHEKNALLQQAEDSRQTRLDTYFTLSANPTTLASKAPNTSPHHKPATSPSKAPTASFIKAPIASSSKSPITSFSKATIASSSKATIVSSSKAPNSSSAYEQNTQTALRRPMRPPYQVCYILFITYVDLYCNGLGLAKIHSGTSWVRLSLLYFIIPHTYTAALLRSYTNDSAVLPLFSHRYIY